MKPNRTRKAAKNYFVKYMECTYIVSLTETQDNIQIDMAKYSYNCNDEKKAFTFLDSPSDESQVSCSIASSHVDSKSLKPVTVFVLQTCIRMIVASIQNICGLVQTPFIV